MRVLFVQPFGMEGGLGSSQIFQSLLRGAPCQTGMLVYGLDPPLEPPSRDNLFIRERPHLGRIERSRLAGLANFSRILTWKSSRNRMQRTMSAWNPSHVHAHIHGTGFIHAAEWCAAKRVPFSACIHDDIRHLASGDPWKGFIERRAGDAWRLAANRFVVSPEIGEEYSRRYGRRKWLQVTDGLEKFPEGPRPLVQGRLNLYFSGGMNVPYEPNFLATQQGLKRLAAQEPGLGIRFVLRGGRRISREDPGAPPMEPLPYAPRSKIQRDLELADVLYLPLSIDGKFSNFAKFSLSTKMVGYLASGLPIFYHGPAESAAHRLLSEYGACSACFSNDPQEILEAVRRAVERRTELVANALRLAREKFELAGIRHRFWSAIQAAAGMEPTSCNGNG